MRVAWVWVALAASAGLPWSVARTQQKTPAKSPAKTAPAPAQARAEKYPIASLKVEGNANYTAAQIVSVAGLKVGDLADRHDFEAARERLLATGAFESVGFAFEPDETRKAYVAQFRVAEVNPVFPIRFEELKAGDKELLKMLAEHDPLFSAEKTPATKQVIDRYSQWIQEYLKRPGTVMGEVTQPAPGQLAIVFRPAGQRPVVARVFFEGNKVVTEKALQEAIWPVGVGSVYSEGNFRLLLDTSVRPVYEARGRLRVSFPRVMAEPVTDVQGLKVTVSVEEGEVYTLGKTGVSGPCPVDPDQLLRSGDFKKGDVANFDAVTEGMERMRLQLLRAGYLNAKLTNNRQLDDNKRTVDLLFTVEAGDAYKMGALQVKGLDLSGESEIRRIWTLKEGSAFNPEYPDYFLKRVKQDGMFDNLGETKASVQRNEKTHTVDVTLSFGGVDPAQEILRRRGGRGGN